MEARMRQAMVAVFCLGLGCMSQSDFPIATDQRSTSVAIPNGFEFRNPTGRHSTISTAGDIDLTGPFFQDLGTNGRRCVSCHQPSDGWTVTPPSLQERFDATGGLDPIFRTNDGANSPVADVSTVEARRNAYSMLLTK